MSEISIFQPGILTTVQDIGRVGYQKFGMPPAGVMDQDAYLLGQYLVGNEVPQAALECTIIGPSFTCEGNLVLAVTGAKMDLKKNGASMEHCSAIFCAKGDKIELGAAKNGLRSYLSFAGGIDVPALNGSRSTYLKSHLGGFKGRKLCSGDILPIGEVAERQRFFKLPSEYVPAYRQEDVIRVVLGPQEDMFSEKGIGSFCAPEGYVITAASDRMGYRLKGEAIDHRGAADIISDGTAFGSIQVPADGQPIILMADRQTTGGYSKIATVISPDLPRLAQMGEGAKVIFQIVDVAKANGIYRAAKKERQALYGKCLEVFGGVQRYTAQIKGKTYRITVRRKK